MGFCLSGFSGELQSWERFLCAMHMSCLISFLGERLQPTGMGSTFFVIYLLLVDLGLKWSCQQLSDKDSKLFSDTLTSAVQF